MNKQSVVKYTVLSGAALVLTFGFSSFLFGASTNSNNKLNPGVAGSDSLELLGELSNDFGVCTTAQQEIDPSLQARVSPSTDNLRMSSNSLRQFIDSPNESKKDLQSQKDSFQICQN